MYIVQPHSIINRVISPAIFGRIEVDHKLVLYVELFLNRNVAVTAESTKYIVNLVTYTSKMKHNHQSQISGFNELQVRAKTKLLS